MIRHNETAPDLFILQPISALLGLRNLAINAAYAEKRVVTVIAAHHISNFHNLLADVYSVHILYRHSTTTATVSPVGKPFLATLFSLGKPAISTTTLHGRYVKFPERFHHF